MTDTFEEIYSQLRHYREDASGRVVRVECMWELVDSCARPKWQIKTDVGPAMVSTVFLTVDHAYKGGPPVLWETMIRGVGSEFCRRYTSRADAVRGHGETVEALILGRDPEDYEIDG